MLRGNRIRMLIVLVAAVAGLVGCAAPGTTPGGTGPIVPPPPVRPPSLPADACPAAGFRLTADEIEGALGLRAMAVELLNCGAHSMTLHGYPAVRLGNAEHERLPTAIKQGVSAVAMIDEWNTPPTRFTLRPGQSAVALLVWRGTTEYTPEGPVTATTAQLAVADRQPFQTVDLQGQKIDLGTTGKLAVSPWRPGRQPAEPAPTDPRPEPTGHRSQPSNEPTILPLV